ncbi:MAG: hypothetical protein ACOX4R_03320 [Lentihominibacter sp.]|jgi:hypothetical protein
MNLMKKIVTVLAVLTLAFGVAGCGNSEEAGEGTQEEIVTEETNDGKTFLAEDLVTIEEMSEITGVPIVDIKLWDNDFMGLLGATYLGEEDEYDGFKLNCYQQAYCGAAYEDVEHPEISGSVKQEYEDRKLGAEESGDLEVVESLGQEAFYYTVLETLYVLYNDDIYLEVNDDYSDDPATQKEMAIKIAEKAIKSLDEKL